MLYNIIAKTYGNQLLYETYAGSKLMFINGM